MNHPPEYEKPKPVRFTALFYGLTAGALVLAVAVLFLPIEWSEAKNRFRLWQTGARPVLWEKHRGFTLDRCGGKAPAECECVWMIHGMGDSVSTWKRFFLEPKSLGEKSVRLFAVDLPGHGGSLKRKNPIEYRASAMAKELEEKITAEANCSKNLLIGNSFGGWVATLMALDSPKLFAHLVLIGPSGMTENPVTKDLFEDVTIETLKEFQKRAYSKPRELPDAAWKMALSRYKTNAVSEIRKAQVLEDRLDQKLLGLTVPTTLIYGDSDRIVPREEIDIFLKGQPAIRFRLLTQCGHLPQKECPEKLFPLIQELVD